MIFIQVDCSRPFSHIHDHLMVLYVTNMECDLGGLSLSATWPNLRLRLSTTYII
jgi:hypothetical protein